MLLQAAKYLGLEEEGNINSPSLDWSIGSFLDCALYWQIFLKNLTNPETFMNGMLWILSPFCCPICMHTQHIYAQVKLKILKQMVEGTLERGGKPVSLSLCPTVGAGEVGNIMYL